MTLKEKLRQKSRHLLSIYCTAGYPSLDSLPVVLSALEEQGVDMIEIGIPYSDPISDGPTIQESNALALANGITLERIFEQLSAVHIHTPKILMGYFNSILQFGVERFCARCRECQVTAVIIPDLPPEVFADQYQTLFHRHGISMIFLITPETPRSRILELDAASDAFIYAVSSSGTTGNKPGIQHATAFLSRISELGTQNPVLVGFNIRSREDFKLACRYTSGGIIGSAFIRHISGASDLSLAIEQFVSNITSRQKP